jgi:hypothetical protein
LGINGANTFYIGGIDADIGDILFVDGGATRASFANGGDISFYEDTGTTAKLFWDASAESLGIGTSSPDKILHIKTAVNNTAFVRIESTATDSYPTLSLKNDAREYQLTAHGPLGDKFTIYDGTAGAHRFVIDSSGKVGIGTSSPSTKGHFYSGTSMDQLTVDGTGAIETGINFASGGTTYGQIYFNNVSPYDMSVLQQYSTGSLIFGTNDTERLRIDASGNVKIGDSSTDITSKLTVSGNASSDVATFMYDGSAGTYLDIDCAGPNGAVNLRADARTGAYPPLLFTTGSTERLRIDSSGNVGIGRTPDTVYSGSLQLAFGNGSQLATSTAGNPSLTITDNSYLNASGNHVYKTTNPSTRLEQYNGTLTFGNAASGTAGATISYAERLRIDASGNLTTRQSTGNNFRVVRNGDNSVEIGNYNATDGYQNTAYVSSTHTFYAGTAGAGSVSRAVDIDASGNVGIGTSSPSQKLHVAGNIVLDAAGFVGFGGGTNYIEGSATNLLKFGTANVERMRIDSSGNLLVGKTATAFGTAGVEASASNGLWSTRSGLPALALNRLSTDGSIADFYKDGTNVGSIGVTGGDLYIENGITGISFNNAYNALIPTTTGGVVDDANQDLGISSHRFKDLYLSGGVYLGGTGAANHLDDYEEGTWTPMVTNQVSTLK